MGSESLLHSLNVLAESFIKEVIYSKSPLEREAEEDFKKKKQSM